MSLERLIGGFNTTPFLFVGSGITRRYYGLPDWKGLLTVFARKVNNDEFSYAMYESIAKTETTETDLLPKVAELIEKDFNLKWFRNEISRNIPEPLLIQIAEQGLSPFKAEVAEFIKCNSTLNLQYEGETLKLAEATQRSISGIITTNYDTFLENINDGYTVYVGQEELIFSPIQGVSEIYKIHGCVSHPNSLIINSNDYNVFNGKSAYLAAKLMTIFMEYPIVFLGYSLGDSNIQSILSSIISCLSSENLQKLQNRFVFVEYSDIEGTCNITPHSITFEDGKMLMMTKIQLFDYTLLYNALLTKKATLPIKILRMFKQEFYDFALTNIPSMHLKVAELSDTRLADDDIVIAVGTTSDFAERGFIGVSASDWYRDIIMDDLGIPADKVLESVYPNLKRGNPILPFFKYLSLSEQNFPILEAKAAEIVYDNLIPKSLQKQGKTYCIESRTVNGIVEYGTNYEDKTYLYKIAYLSESEINIDELENVLRDIFRNNLTVLEPTDKTYTDAEKSNLRRLIRIFEFLKYKKRAPTK